MSSDPGDMNGEKQIPVPKGNQLIIEKKGREDKATTTAEQGNTTLPPESKTQITISENDLDHIFRDKPGHLKENNAHNRDLLISTATNAKNFFGICERGSSWFAENMPDGTQIWAEVRNGKVRNGGINSTPKQFNRATGLKKSL